MVAVLLLGISAAMGLLWLAYGEPPISPELALAIIVLSATAGAYVIFRLIRALRPRDELQHLCVHCSYDLRAATSDICPECGNPIEQAVSVICESCGNLVNFAVQTIGTRQTCPICGVESEMPD